MMNFLASNASTTAKAVVNNTFFQIIGKVVSMSITILATVIITRMYGREGYGEFNLMQNIPALFFIIVDFGLNAIATRELSKDFEKAEKYLGNIILARLAMSLALMAVVGFSISLFPYSQNLKFGIYLSLFLILTQALYATTNIIFQVKLRYDYSTIGYVLGSLVVLVLVLVLSYLKVNIVWVNFSYIIGGLITFFTNIWLISRYIDLKLKISFDPEILKYLLVQSLPLGLMFIFSQINFKADSLMLSVLKVPPHLNLSNTSAVALYGLPYKIFEVALVVPTFFMNAAYPVYVRHMSESKEKLKSTFFKSLRVLLGLALAGTLVGIVFSAFAINILGGQEFKESVAVLRLLLLGLPVFYLTQPISWLIVTLGKQKYLPWVYLVSAVFNVSANFVLIPVYSFYASAVLTWVSELIILVLLVILAYKTWKQYYARA